MATATRRLRGQDKRSKANTQNIESDVKRHETGYEGTDGAGVSTLCAAFSTTQEGRP